MNRDEAKADDESGSNLRTLSLGKSELLLDEDPALLDKVNRSRNHRRKSTRSCCSFLDVGTADASARRILVPLYDVLWASSSGSLVTVDYVVASSSSLRLESWTGRVDAASPSPEAFVSALLARAYGDARVRKRALVAVNPNSGPGGALVKWERYVKPLFEAAHMTFDVVVLEHGGEAADLAESIDLLRYDIMVACSGDGTPHEIFNGLARRPDAARALSTIAVGHIPCGSGNAMACNLYGSNQPATAAQAIVKGVVTPMDLVSITQGDRRSVSFLSQALGLVAESDLATEHLRWMGSLRFDVGVFTRLFRRKCYPCDLAVKVEADETLGKNGVRAHYSRHVVGRSPDIGSPAVDGGLPLLRFGTVQDELPEGWELISHDKIGLFYCGNMAYMAPDVNMFSAALASDGCMDLVLMRGDLWPLTALKTLLSAQKGRLFNSPHVSYRKVSAYRIIPRGQDDGYISIDGERAPFAPFQAEVHRALGRVISKRGRFETSGPPGWESPGPAEGGDGS
ncbi:sphingosine kinase [Ophiocordyceps camponoti-floridani]|uniref:Sphingosine kinase n=1 Tax=Ophiocordyceps camponoti-floridani TaxID=2030778 RepID=A0A8H4VCH2_9HYPO|nr:sphingosine kinase [Ophiocordyceps camponoti-floridani]